MHHIVLVVFLRVPYYAVLHLEKGTGNDAPISSHIERTVGPKMRKSKKGDMYVRISIKEILQGESGYDIILTCVALLMQD